MSIDVSQMHPSFAAMYPSIIAARHCFLGERAIKEAGELYLPKLTGMTDPEYKAYKLRATFFSIVSRTVLALTGLAMQGEPQMDVPREIRDQMADADHGLQFQELRYKAVCETLLCGRVGILIDAPRGSKTLGIYPYVSESIFNWRLDSVGRPTMIVLVEDRQIEDPANRFKLELDRQYRVLELVKGIYTQTVYNKKSEIIVPTFAPEFQGKTIDYIPFFMQTPIGLGFNVERSPMEDIVSVNLSHYRTSADLEHGRHFCGLPTPVISGSEVGTKSLKVGGSKAWVLPGADAKAYYLEFKGEGLKSLENALKEKESQLSSLSVNILDRATRGSESADTVRLRYSSETASLAMIVSGAESLMLKVYSTIAKLSDYGDVKSIIFSKQFISGTLTAKEVKDYSETYLTGGMSVDAYVSLLRKGGVLTANRTDESEKSALEAIATAKAAAMTTKQAPTTN